MGRCLFINFKEGYDSVKSEVLYNILLEFCILNKPVRVIKICFNETFVKVFVGTLCLIYFLIRTA
jgi:hypothetical protein